MNTNWTEFRRFSKIVSSCGLGESSLSIERVEKGKLVPYANVRYPQANDVLCNRALMDWASRRTSALEAASVSALPAC